MYRHDRLASLSLAHVLVMSLVVSFLMLNCRIVVQGFFRCILKGKVSAMRHLLRLVVLLRRKALNQLIVLLYLLLVVLHGLKFQIH